MSKTYKACLFFILFVSAQTTDARNQLIEHLDHLGQSQKKQFSLFNHSTWRDQFPKEHQSCVEQYRKMYEDDVLNLNLVYGYHDDIESSGLSRGDTVTRDQGFFVGTKEALKLPCSQTSSKVCGFKETYDGFAYAELEKTQAMVRDGKRVFLKIKVRLAHSSYTRYDAKNLNFDNSLSRDQKELTIRAEELFFGGIQGKFKKPCEVCIYYGHARDGGGPDFAPVPLDWRKRNGKPNYTPFKKHMPGYKELLWSLESAVKPPQLVALFACKTRNHFWKKKATLKTDRGKIRRSLNNYSKKTGFLLSKKLSWPHNWGRMTGNLLDTIVGFKCNRALNENMKALEDSRATGKSEFYVTEGNFL